MNEPKDRPDSPGIWWARVFGRVQPVEVLPRTSERGFHVYVIANKDWYAPTDDIFSGLWLKAEVPDLPKGGA